MNRKNNPGLGSSTQTGLRSQAAQPTAGSPSLFGLISKANQGILKEPAKPKGILKNANQPSSTVAPTSTSKTTTVKQKQDVFLEAKSMIEQIQKGLWKPSEQSGQETSNSSTKQDKVFKVPMAIPTLKATKRTAQKKSGKINPKSSNQVVSASGNQSKPEASNKDVTNTTQKASVKKDEATPPVINLVDYEDDDESVIDAGDHPARKYTEDKALKELDMYSARRRDEQDKSDHSKTDKRLDREYRRDDSDEERSNRSRSHSYSPERRSRTRDYSPEPSRSRSKDYSPEQGRSRSKDYSPEAQRYRDDRHSRNAYIDNRSPSPDVFIGNLTPPMDMSRYSRYSAYHSSGYSATGHPNSLQPGYDSYGAQGIYDRARQMGGYYSGSESYRGGSPPYYGSAYQSRVRASSPGFDARNYSSMTYGSRSTSASYESQRSHVPYYTDGYRQTGYDRVTEKDYTHDRRKEYEREYERGYSNRGDEHKYEKEYSRSADDYKSRHSDSRRDSPDYRDRDRDRERDRDRDYEKEKERDRERDSNRDHREKRGRTRKRDRARDENEKDKDSTKERNKISFAIMSKAGTGGQTMDRLEEFDDSSGLESGDENEGAREKKEKSPEFVRWDEFEDDTGHKIKAQHEEDKKKKKSTKDELYEDYLFSDRYLKDDDNESIIGVRNAKMAGTKDASSNKDGTKKGEPGVGYRCEDCDVTCTDKYVYDIHLLGVKHALTQQKKAEEAKKPQNATTSTGRKSRFATDASGKPVVVGGIQPPGVAAVIPTTVIPAVSKPTIPQAGPRPGLIPPAVSLPGIPRPDFSKPPPALNVPRPDFTKPPPNLSVGARPSAAQSLLPTPDFNRPPQSHTGLVRPGLNTPGIPSQQGPIRPGLNSAYVPALSQQGPVRPGLNTPGIPSQQGPIGPGLNSSNVPASSHQVRLAVNPPGLSHPTYTVPPPAIRPTYPPQVQPTAPRHGITQTVIPQQPVSQTVISQQSLLQPNLSKLGTQKPIVSQQTLLQPTLSQLSTQKTNISQQGILQPAISQLNTPKTVVPQQGIQQLAVPLMNVPKPVVSQQAMPQPLMSLNIPHPVISQQSVSLLGAPGQIISQQAISGPITPQQVVPLPDVSQKAGSMLSSNLPVGPLPSSNLTAGIQHSNTQSVSDGHRRTRFDGDIDDEFGMNEGGSLNYRSNSRHGIHVTIPKPMGPLQATRIQTHRVTLIWDYLSEEEEKMIDRYVVEYRNARETHWVTVDHTTDHEYIVDGLQENTDYLFRVVAMCGPDKSEYLESILTTTAKKEGSPKRQSSRDRDTKRSKQSDRTRSHGRRRSRSRSTERRRSRSAERQKSRSPGRQRSRDTKRSDLSEKRKEQTKGSKDSGEKTDKIEKKMDIDASVLEIKLKSYAEKEFSKSKLGSAVDQGSGSKQKVECHFYKMFKKYPEEPMLGLDHLYETQSYNPLIPPYYKCKMCKQSGSAEIMIRHVIGFAHRMAIIRKLNPVLSESIGMLYARKLKLAKVLKESKIIEDNIGRGSVNVMRMLNPADHDGKVIFEEPIPVKAPATTRPKYEEPEDTEEPDPQDSEFMKLYTAAVEAEALPDKAIIGLKYVQELIHPDNSELPLYRCNLCKCLLRHGTILFHLIGKKHRITYVKKHYPSQVESSSTKSSSFKRSLPELAAEIEEKEGIGAVQITKCKNTRAWSQKNKYSQDQSSKQTNQESADTNKTVEGDNKGIKFGIKKPEDQTTTIKQTNVLEEETKQSSKEILDWTTENEILQTKIQNQTIIKSTRKSRFMTVYGPTMKKYSVIGTQWITEFQKPDPKAEPWFMCFMCQQKIQWKSIIDHVTSTAHRFNYLKTAHKDLSKSLFEQIGSSRLGMKHLVEEFAQKVIRLEGYPTEMEVMIELNINTEALKSVMKIKDGSKTSPATSSSVGSSTTQNPVTSRAGQTSIPSLLQSTSTIHPSLIPSTSHSQSTNIPSLLSAEISPSPNFKQYQPNVGSIHQLLGDNSTPVYENVIQKQAEKLLTQQILATGHFPPPGTVVSSYSNINEDYLTSGVDNTNEFGKRSSSTERYQDSNKRFKGSTDEFSSEDRFQNDEVDMHDTCERGQRSRSPSSRSHRSADRGLVRRRDRSRRSRDRDNDRHRRSRDRDRSKERHPRDRERKGRYPDRQSLIESPDRSDRDRRKRSSSRDRSSRDRNIRSSSRERRGRYANDRDDTRDRPRERTRKSRFSDLEPDRASSTDRDSTQDRPRGRNRPSRFSELEPSDSNVNESAINLQVTSDHSMSGRVVRQVSPGDGRSVMLGQEGDTGEYMEGDYGSDQFDDEILEGDGSFTSDVNLEEDLEDFDQEISNDLAASANMESGFVRDRPNIGGSIRGQGRDLRGEGSFRNNFGVLKSGINELSMMPNQGLIPGSLVGNMSMGMIGGGPLQAVGNLGSTSRPGLLGEYNGRQGVMSSFGAMGTGQERDFMQSDNMPDPTREEIDQLMQRAKSLMNVIENMDNDGMTNQNMGAIPPGLMQMNMFNNMGQSHSMAMGQMPNMGLIGGNRGPGRGFGGQRGYRGGGPMQGNF